MAQRLTCRTVTNAVRASVCPNMTLHRGVGYFYFVFDSGDRYETHSVMVFRLNDMPLERWVQAAEIFASELQECSY